MQFLEESPNEPFTGRQIAEGIFKAFPAECEIKREKSDRINTDKELVTAIAAEISSGFKAFKSRYPQLEATNDRPRKYCWSSSSDSTPIMEVETDTPEPKNSSFNEHDLYPLLAKYLRHELGLYTKRIDERKSSNKHGAQGNRWLYPDMVGVENLISDWDREIKELVKVYADKKTKLWSFEVKLSLKRSNVREAYFQAVSNSSWANFGYLVAARIEGDGTIKELRMLYSLHGIGLIQIDPETPEESQILIPARERQEVDWTNCDRLTKENKDFRKYVQNIRHFYQTGDLRPSDWD